MKKGFYTNKKVKLPPPSNQPPKPKPEWNSELIENPHKISRAE